MVIGVIPYTRIFILHFDVAFKSIVITFFVDNDIFIHYIPHYFYCRYNRYHLNMEKVMPLPPVAGQEFRRYGNLGVVWLWLKTSQCVSGVCVFLWRNKQVVFRGVRVDSEQIYWLMWKITVC